MYFTVNRFRKDARGRHRILKYVQNFPGSSCVFEPSCLTELFTRGEVEMWRREDWGTAQVADALFDAIVGGHA